jgi:hypothetical protein
MTRRRSRAIKRALLAIVLGAVLSSCSGEAHTATSSGTAHTATSSGTAHTATSSGTANTATSSGTAHPSTSSRPSSSNSSSSGSPINSSTATSTSTAVPDVDSQPLPIATQNLQQVGLTVGMQKYETNLSLPYMSVITTDPAAGSLEPAGFAVTLLLSAGPPCLSCRMRSLPMPDVVGQTLRQAKTTLAEQGLTLETYSFEQSPAPQGEVIQSTPPAGAQTTVWVGVELVVSAGQASQPSVSPSTGSPSVSPSAASPFPSLSES